MVHDFVLEFWLTRTSSKVDLLESSLKEQSACQISPPFPASELFAPELLQDEDVVGNSSVTVAQSEHKVLDYEHNKSFNNFDKT